MVGRCRHCRLHAVRAVVWLRVALAVTGWLLTLSTLMCALGLLAFLVIGHFGLLVGIVLLASMGGGAIDVGLHHYVIEHHSERAMQWLHASFGIGVTIGPALMGLALISEGGWRLGYLIVGSGLIGLSLLFLATSRVWPKLAMHPEAQAGDGLRALGQLRVLIAVGSFALYCGLELAVGIWAFSVMVEGRSVDPVAAAFWVSAYWASFTMARVLFGFVASEWGHWRTQAVGLAIAGVGLGLWSIAPLAGSALGLVALVLIGFGFGPLYPAMMSGTEDRVGSRFKDSAVALQVSVSAIGAGAVTAWVGWVADQRTTDSIPWVLLGVILVFVGLELVQRRLNAA